MNRDECCRTSQGGGALRYDGTILKVTDPRASRCRKHATWERRESWNQYSLSLSLSLLFCSSIRLAPVFSPFLFYSTPNPHRWGLHSPFFRCIFFSLLLLIPYSYPYYFLTNVPPLAACFIQNFLLHGRLGVNFIGSDFLIEILSTHIVFRFQIHEGIGESLGTQKLNKVKLPHASHGV